MEDIPHAEIVLLVGSNPAETMPPLLMLICPAFTVMLPPAPLPLRSMQYIPGYRTPAGTGTGLCFAVWN